MSSSLADALASAQLSWHGNYTTGDERWGLKQLHGLYQLIINNRDEILKILPGSVPNIVHEFELARLAGDIARHISIASNMGRSASIELPLLDKLEIAYHPVGRSLIVGECGNPLRWVLNPLAASLAAGNTTILTVPTETDPFIMLLAREWNKYFDRDSVFLVRSFVPSQLDLDLVDKVSIYDSSTAAYRLIMASPKVQVFYTSNMGLNIALITEGKKSWTRVAHEIKQASQLTETDRLHAVFVRDEDMNSLQASLGQQQPTVILNDLMADGELKNRIESAKRTGSYLTVVVQSLEGSTDALIKLSTPIAQVAILGPQASQVYDFVRRWVPSRLVSIDSVCPVALPEANGIIQHVSNQSSFISPDVFSRQVYTCRSRRLGVIDDVSSLRDSYRKLVEPLEPEPLGERIGFFKQVEYLVKGTGAVVGVLTIAVLYYGLRRFR